MISERLIFKTTIDGSRETVWTTLLSDVSYREWTSVFAPGSYARTDWKKGSKAQFLDNNNNGLLAEIAENKPHEFMSIRHLGDIKNGREIPNPNWIGYENYILKTVDGQTELTIELDVPPDFKDMMNDMWPKALEKVKEIAERQS